MKLLTQVLVDVKIDMTKCIGSATDGAANMQDKYQGFSSLLTEKSNQVHIWCYAHILDLCRVYQHQVIMQSVTLFSVLNDIAVFIQE